MPAATSRTSPSGPQVATVAISGFPNRTDSTFTATAATRTFTIGPVGAFYEVYVGNNRFMETAAQSVVWPNVEGFHFFFIDPNGILQTGTAAQLHGIILGGGALISSIYWNATAGTILFLAEERHGFMDPTVHDYLHHINGAMWEPGSGGALTDILPDQAGNLDTHAQLGVEGVTVLDEDLELTYTNGNPQIINAPAQLPCYYLLGADPGLWRRVPADAFPLIYSGKPGSGYVGAVGGRIAYNQLVGGNWQLTEAGNAQMVLAHIYATNEITEPYIVITGQALYANQNLARLGATVELTALRGIARLLSQEEAPLGTVIFQTAGYANTPNARIRTTDLGDDYEDFRGTRQTDLRP